jgi:putative addiction module antidote
MKLTVRPIGGSAGVILPKEVLARLKVDAGDAVFLTETPDGYALSPYDPEFEKDMELAREFMKERRNVLRELAK